MSDSTPLMRQYQEVKSRYPNAILFFRLGDFYEMFFEDAVEASKILGITLTSRDKSKENQIPLCGVPYHSATGYIAKLIRSGQNVAICEQMEDPKEAKGIVRRDVVRVITPGTLLEEDLLQKDEHNFLTAVSLEGGILGFSFLDLSTGDFYLCQFEGEEGKNRFIHELIRIAPKEILIPQSEPEEIRSSLEGLPESVPVHRREDRQFSFDRAYRLLLKHFKVHSLEGFGCQGQTAGITAAGVLLQFLQETCLSSLDHIQTLKRYSFESHMVLDLITQRNLELVKGTLEEKKEGSLLGVLDLTLTPMGARTLKRWLLHPLLNLEDIAERQGAVEIFLEDLSLRTKVRNELKGISDLERLIGRVSFHMANGRDVVGLKDSLKALPALYGILHAVGSPLLQSLLKKWDSLEGLVLCIEKALVDEPPMTIKEGGLIREGFHAGLDELREACREGKNWISTIERDERKRTGIETLKVRYNQVFGYYIEITKTHLSKVPPDYIRKQTLVNAERYITPRLKELEAKVLGAEEKIKALEHDLFDSVRQTVALETSRVQSMAQVIAQVDTLSALAETAARNHYVKPQVVQESILEITEGRHPVLEGYFPAQRFVPNDTFMDGGDHQLLILTGPNMAGKSTYMRQVALIGLMAQVGSFVPAKSARIGIIDRIFTRVGASDHLVSGQSTFMTEMNETANILHHATPRSLVLLDEIGRGTSTYDGLSIAWAVAEYLLDSNKARPRTLFATHYHELTDLAFTHSGAQNYTSLVREWNEEIIFLRKISKGGSDKSYGIHVARLAGLPNEVIDRAKVILSQLETWKEKNQEKFERVSPGTRKTPLPQRDLFENRSSKESDEAERQLVRDLLNLDPHSMTPLQALIHLDQLKKKAQDLFPSQDKEVL